LDACDFGANSWCEFLDLGAFCEKIFKGCICIFAVFDVGEGLEGRVLFIVVVDR
jgi:hypothetical protein